MDFEAIIAKLSEKLSAKRFRHSVGVSETAERLAELHGCDKAKAKLAGILHDCARELPSNRLLSTAEAFGIVVGDLERHEPVLLHAALGARMAQSEYGVTDREVHQSIRLHTTGGSNMTVLDKIIFLADVIEPGRSFPGVDKIRELARENLDKALLAAYDQSLQYLIERNGIIHPDTIQGRNELLMPR